MTFYHTKYQKRIYPLPKLSFQYVRQEAPETLLEFLARRFKYHTILEWENLVVDGHVKVNGRRVSPNLLLETRHKILYERPPFKEPPVDENLFAFDAVGEAIKSIPEGRHFGKICASFE